jgi:hypothetical protein
MLYLKFVLDHTKIKLTGRTTILANFIMFKMNKKHIRYSVNLAIVFFMLVLSGCTDKNLFYRAEIHSEICDKYIDEFNHNTEKICVMEEDECSNIIQTGPITGLWEYANIGDSLIKERDTYILTVKKGNGDSKDFEYTGWGGISLKF